MASAKGADTTKSTTFGLLWGSLHFGGPRGRKSKKSTRGLGNGFCKISGLYNFPRGRKSRKSTGALEMASGKGAGFTKSTTFGLLWGSLHFGGPRSCKSRTSTRTLEVASGKGAGSAKSTTFGLLWCSEVPEAGNPANIQGPWKWPGLYTINMFWAFWGSLHFGGPTTFGLLWGSLHFGGPRSCKSRTSTRTLEVASGKGAGSAKSTTFGLLWCSEVPEAGNLGSGPDSTQSTCFGPFGVPSISAVRQLLGFCGVASISEVSEAGNPANARGLGNGSGKRVGIAKASAAFVEFPSFRRPTPRNPNKFYE